MLERGIENELIPFCEKYGMGVLPYYPLANGFLTGKYRKGRPMPTGTRLDTDDRGIFTDEKFQLIEKLVSFSQDREKSVLDLAFAWLLARPVVSSVIAGATTPDQVLANASTADWEMSSEDYLTVTDLLL